jgi:hypothetical protein
MWEFTCAKISYLHNISFSKSITYLALQLKFRAYLSLLTLDSSQLRSLYFAANVDSIFYFDKVSEGGVGSLHNAYCGGSQIKNVEPNSDALSGLISNFWLGMTVAHFSHIDGVLLHIENMIFIGFLIQKIA